VGLVHGLETVSGEVGECFKTARDIVAGHMRSSMEFGAHAEGDKEGTSTADAIEDRGPGMDG
jgi:hypothetical protein